MIEYIRHDGPVPEEILQYIEVFAQDVDTAVEHCTPYGKGLKLLSNKPDDLYYAYVWRMARFNCGDDMKMPIGAFWDIGEAITGDFQVRISFHLIDESRKKVLDMLDELSDKLLGRIGLSTTRAAQRWSGALRGMSL